MNILAALLSPFAKPFFVSLYVCFGIFLVSIAAGFAPRAIAVPKRFIGALIAVAAVLAAVTLIRFSLAGPWFPLCVICGTALFALRDDAPRSTRFRLALLAVVTSSVSLAWWLSGGIQLHGWWRLPVFALVLLSVEAGLSWRGERATGLFVGVVTIVFGAAGFFLLADMSAYRPGSTPLALLMHHHGAYIGSALHVLAGLVPFYDVPLQYGLGPTLLLSAACRLSGCRPGLEFLVAGSTLLMGVLILAMALSGARTRGRAWIVAVTATVFFAVFLWPGFPDLGNIPAAAPSVGGMRFLPLILVSFFLFFGMSRAAAVAFVAAVLWAPEVAAMSITVYGFHEAARLGFVRAALRTAALCAGSYGAFALIHHLIYGIWIQPDVMLEYVLHVPGPLPIDPFTDVLLLSGALAWAAWLVLQRREDGECFRRDLIVSSLLFATTTYYLGRSHPNNICNLMPFITLVALRAVNTGDSGPTPAWWPRLANIGLATACASIVLSQWIYVPFEHRPQSGTPAETGLDADMDAIRAHIVNPEHLGIADFGTSLNRHPAETVVWTPMDPVSLWTYVPAERRQLYIRRSAERLQRSGWVVIRGDPTNILGDFQVAYTVTDQTAYDYDHVRYTVARLVPMRTAAEVTESAGSDPGKSGLFQRSTR